MYSIVVEMPKKPKGRGNRGRGRGNNGQDHQQPRPGRSENGTAAIVSDREEKKQNLDGEGSERRVKETAAPSQRTSRSQESADKAHSKEHKNAISWERSQGERPGPNEISLRPESASFVKPATNAEKCEQRQKSCVQCPIPLKVRFQIQICFILHCFKRLQQDNYM